MHIKVFVLHHFCSEISKNNSAQTKNITDNRPIMFILNNQISTNKCE